MSLSFAKRYDFETFIGILDAYMKANFPGIIAQMNADKTDLTLAVPDSNAYYFQSITENEVPFDPFVFYGEVGTSTVPNGDAQAKEYNIQVAILIANKSLAKGIMGKMLLRYRECMLEMFKGAWTGLNKNTKVEVSGISPFPFAVVDTYNSHMGIGVNINIVIP